MLLTRVLDRPGALLDAKRVEYAHNDLQELYSEKRVLQQKHEQHLLELGKVNNKERAVTALNIAYGGVTAALSGNPLALIPAATSTINFLMDQTGQYGKLATWFGTEEESVRNVARYIDMAAGVFNFFSNGATPKGLKRVAGEFGKLTEGLLVLKRTELQNIGTEISAERDELNVHAGMAKSRESDVLKSLEEGIELDGFLARALVEADKIETKTNKKIMEANA